RHGRHSSWGYGLSRELDFDSLTSSARSVFLDLGFPPKEAKCLLAHTDAQINESIRPKQQLMDEIAEWMEESSVTQAAAAEVRLRLTYSKRAAYDAAMASLTKSVYLRRGW